MKRFLKNYNKYIIPLLIIYLVINIIKSVFNVYFLIILFATSLYIYKTNKRLFKKIIYKILFRDKAYNINNKVEAAKNSLKGINEIIYQIENKVNIEMINYEKNKIEQQLNSSDYNVVLFGAGSCGKTSLARGLLKTIVGEISPTIGTTKKLNIYKINIPFLKRNINIIDTPGLFEASIEGKRREENTIKKASKSDLIIFVIDQDLNKYELYLIQQLSKIGKSIIIALNKCDLRSRNQNESIKRNIVKLVNEFSDKTKIIFTIASPQTISNVGSRPKKQEILVDNLLNEIIDILDRNGEELLADNILFQCNKLGNISKDLINRQRYFSSRKLINRYSWITSGVIFITPLPGIDLLASSVINIQMVIEISKIYGANLTKERAAKLTKSIVKVLATLGVVKGGMNLFTNLLSTNITTRFITKSVQSITAAWIIRIVGFAFTQYFENNQSWGDGGIHEIVQNLYEINKREDLLKDFLKEALRKINLKENSSNTRQLPPHSRFD